MKVTLAGAATVAAMATAFVGINATSASAMNPVSCNGISEYTQITSHLEGHESDVDYTCYANGGEVQLPTGAGINTVITHIHTGVNHVQYLTGDGGWLPAQPLAPNGEYDVDDGAPGGGAVVQEIRIV